MPALQSSVQQEIVKLRNDSGFVELYTLDCSAIGGPVYRFSNYVSSTGGNISFANNVYTFLPIASSGWDFTQTGSPPKPKLQVSNVNKTLLAAVISLGDLVGCSVTRIRTYEKFLDSGSSPNSSAFIGPDIYTIEQKTYHDNELIEFQLTSSIDRLGMRLPRRQILKDPTNYNLYAPGVARARIVT